jgi:Phage shock protein B.
MSALFLAIPLTLFVLFVLPVWLWLHYNNRTRRGELSTKRTAATDAVE